MASLEGRVLSLTHELEAAREEAAAAEEARAASVKEYERALAGRVSRRACMYGRMVWVTLLERCSPLVVVCWLGLHTVHIYTYNTTHRSWSCAPAGPSCGRTGPRLGA